MAEAVHDLRQPLQGLQFMVDALARRSQDSQTVVLAGRMQGAVECLRDMFETVVEIYRLEGGLRQPEWDVVAVAPLGNRALSAVRQSDIVGANRLAGSFAEARVRSDQALLDKLVRNLLLNAVANTVAGAVDISGTCRELSYEVRISAVCASRAQALRERAFVELQGSDVHRPIYALGLATLRRYANWLGHPLEVFVGEGQRLILSLELPLTVSAHADRSAELSETS